MVKGIPKVNHTTAFKLSRVKNSLLKLFVTKLLSMKKDLTNNISRAKFLTLCSVNCSTPRWARGATMSLKFGTMALST